MKEVEVVLDTLKELNKCVNEALKNTNDKSIGIVVMFSDYLIDDLVRLKKLKHK